MKEEVKHPLFTGDTISLVNLKASTKQILEQVSEFIEVAEYKANAQKQLHSYTLATNNCKMKLRKQHHIS